MCALSAIGAYLDCRTRLAGAKELASKSHLQLNNMSEKLLKPLRYYAQKSEYLFLTRK